MVFILHPNAQISFSSKYGFSFSDSIRLTHFLYQGFRFINIIMWANNPEYCLLYS